MLGLVLAVVRGHLPEEIIPFALDPGTAIATIITIATSQNHFNGNLNSSIAVQIMAVIHMMAIQSLTWNCLIC